MAGYRLLLGAVCLIWGLVELGFDPGILDSLVLRVQLPAADGAIIKMAWLANRQTVYFFNASTSLGALGASIEEIEGGTTSLAADDFS